MNPYEQHRVELFLSQASLAQLAGVTPQVVLRTEQGLYTMPSVKLDTVLMEQLDVPPHLRPGTVAILHTEYYAFQNRVRQSNYDLVHNAYRCWIRSGSTSFSTLRHLIGTSAIRFCILLCYQPSKLYAYEKSDKVELPKDLYDIFASLGLGEQINGHLTGN